MDKSVYLDKLNKFQDKLNSTPNTKYSIYAKVNSLIIMNMDYEKIAFDSINSKHPYLLTKECIEKAEQLFDSFLNVNFIEDDRSVQPPKKSADVVEKHEELWQKVWTPYDDEELQELIDVRGNRLDKNDLIQYFKGKKCVDFGSGNGSFSFALLERGAKSVHGIDFGKDQVSRAVEASKHRKVADVSNFEVGNVLKTDFKEDSFDFALSNAVFHHLATKEDMQTAIYEVSRVLRK